MPFILNAWYVAAWPAEVASDKLLARTICAKEMVFFRDAAGRAVALEDRCCHRQLPLSQGWMEQSTVRCGYHGMRFDGAGLCVEVPAQDFIPPGARVIAYPVVERHGWIWVWPGDADRADPALVPDMFERNDHPDWTSGGGTTYIKGHYELISDNLLDLTHETYIHRDSLGNQAVVEHPIEVTSGEDTVTVQRLMIDHEPAPFWKKMLHLKLGRDVSADRWQIINFAPPANLVLDVGVAPTGTGVPQGKRSAGVEGCNLNAITPESEDSTWYFWAFSRKFVREDGELSKKLVDTVRGIFEQDRVAIEAVHQTMKKNAGRPVVHLLNDKGQNLARRMVARRLEQEAATQRA
ncbi:MAG: aromatic ring-hydroxylating dioxygenase subunit alpha [Betaproteobacteria bacterium]|nr:aromatic ring-hydroxylating dioxygenase subunit alpha [Betaproteobacteria bacterium]